ncbi:MAG: hypothetical protein L7U25_05860 [Candidatus Poseidonia sp.]|nr:hypothetical protein [Poseidonia sp.]MCH1537537.1 hypothetical protein [Poseidonia sp.]
MAGKYPRSCINCGARIHMFLGHDGRWRAMDYPENTVSGRWEIHNKGGVC